MTRRFVQFGDGAFHPILDTPKGGSPFVAASLCGLEIMFSGSFLSNVPAYRLCPTCRDLMDAAKAEEPPRPRVIRRRRVKK